MSVTKVISNAAILVFFAGGAQAADLYGGYKDQPSYGFALLWQGPYLGGHLGGAWSSSEPAGNVIFLGASPGAVLANRSIEDSGIMGGFQAGYNLQAGKFLIGIEADFGAMGIGGSKTFADASTPGRLLQVKNDSGWYGDLTARGGFIYDRTLIYAKGGFAFFTGGTSVNDNFDNIHQDSGTYTGWTLGAGAEYLLAPNWSIKLEYQYFDFSNNNLNCCFFGSASGRLDDKLTVNTVKLGFNFLLNGPNNPLR